MDQKSLTLWCAYPDDLVSDEIAQSCEECLAEDERARMRAFHFDRDRRAFLAAHALLRNALSHSYPLAPEKWRFSKNAYGKPQLAPEFGTQFNLAHSQKLVICLVSRGSEVGVDLEPEERGKEIVTIASRVFSRSELAQFDRLTGQGQLDRALQLWTLKEAFSKACGMGLSLPLAKLSFLFEGDDARLEVEPGVGIPSQRWQFSLLEHSGHRIAVVTEQMGEATLEICEARPALAEPQRLAKPVTRWYPDAFAPKT